MAGRYMKWAFTMNNPEQTIAPEGWPDIRLCAWQLEMGEEGTPHYQGYVEFTRPKSLNQMTTMVETLALPWAHWSHAVAKRAANIKYCSKEEGRLEGPYFWPDKATCDAKHGAQGKRKDLDIICEMVMAGKSDTEIAADYPKSVLMFGQGIKRLRAALPAPTWEEHPKDCIIYWGPTGTGKTYRLMQECPPGKEWFWAKPGKWFDGYEGQPGIVFNEFRDSWSSYHQLIALLENTPARAREIKGGTVRVTAWKFRFSSNVHPKFWYKGVMKREGYKWKTSPLRRRFSKIILMDEVVVFPQAMEVEDEDEPSSEEDVAALVPDLHGVLWQARQ